MSGTAVKAERVSKSFRIFTDRNQSLKATLLRGRRAKFETFWALKDLSVEIPEGSTYALLGNNGSGKSTLLKCLAGILQPDEGSVAVQGKMAALLELGSGFHPELSGRENIYLNGSILGLNRKQIDSRFDAIIDFSGVERFIDQPVKNYSSGMYVRLGFAIAINVEPDVLLVDEVLAVGDAQFQEKCLEKFVEYKRAGRTVVVVSHDLGTVRNLCDTVAWLDQGQLAEVGPAAKVIDRYVDKSHQQRYAEHGGTRFGSGDIVVESVTLLGSDGQATSRVTTGDRVRLRLDYRADRSVDRPVYGLSIETIDGTVLWVSHSKNDGFVPDVVKGRGSVYLTVPDLHLQAGTYDVSASVTDEAVVHFYDMNRHCLRFDVVRSDALDTSGLVSLGGTWAS